MDNKDIIKVVKSTADLMELHGENEYKIKSYRNAVFNLERYNSDLSQLDQAQLEEIKGVGAKIAANIFQYLTSGSFEVRDELLEATPPGILDLLQIKGLGVKKIKTLWQELNIDTIPALKAAIENGSLKSVKGFGEKSQENILASIEFLQSTLGLLLYQQAHDLSSEIHNWFTENLPKVRISETGELRRKNDIVSTLSYLISDAPGLLETLKQCPLWNFEEQLSGPGIYRFVTVKSAAVVECTITTDDNFDKDLILTTGSTRHLFSVRDSKTILSQLSTISGGNEEAFYTSSGFHWMPPETREGRLESQFTSDKPVELVLPEDIKGVVHCHSTWSDGLNSIAEMASAAASRGYQYLGLTDHSKSAYFYANGLYEERVLEQMEEIDQLNRDLAPFKIFKGIESDILVDGSLDYDESILKEFDFIVASIHGGITNDKKKITERLLKVIHNPYTTIMGHLTGRLLLMRDGYPVDHRVIIDACAANGVIIEINAHPRRLDLDWRWVGYAMEKEVMLSINPDAHRISGIDDIQWGVWSGRKGGLLKEFTFNTKTVEEVEAYFSNRKP